jgi:polysaccharide pyruvyl transferase WcaK-like protein
MMRRALNVFNFWGAGNMGDDLMLAGFLQALDQLGVSYKGRLSSLCSHNVASQTIRFPKVNWIDSSTSQGWRVALAHTELVVGLGDTPFQLTSGDWSLKHLEEVCKCIPAGAETVFINIGAEQECLSRAKEFAAILHYVSRCSTRDSFSHSVLRKVSGNSNTQLSVGGDLANISHESISRKMSSNGKYKLGIIVGYDTLSTADLSAIKEAINATGGPVAFITGDCRDGPGFEFELFNSWTKPFLSPLRRKLQLRRPDYALCTLLELVQPVAECEVVLSSRLHGLLAAAWLGCRVAALGRSSKVVALAKECNIPCIEPPFDSERIREVIKNASVVDRIRLKQFKEESLDGILACKFW